MPIHSWNKTVLNSNRLGMTHKFDECAVVITRPHYSVTATTAILLLLCVMHRAKKAVKHLAFISQIQATLCFLQLHC